MKFIAFSLMLVAFGLAACQTIAPSEPDDWISGLAGADIIILGETHDNAEHHRLQAEVIDRLKPEAVIFEMVPINKTEIAATAIQDGQPLREALDWDASGWPAWSFYEPVFEAASASRIVGAGLDRAEVRRSMSEGAQSVSGLPPEYGLGEALPDTQVQILIQEFIDSHCGMIPTEMAKSMIEAQRLRDAMFAARTLKAHQASPGAAPVILIAGSGHARTDRGVPSYIARVAPDATLLSVGFLEEGSGVDETLFDVTRVTPSAEREDPCAAFETSSE